MKNDTFPIQSYTPKELSNQYRCSVRTFRKWLQNVQQLIGPRIGHFYTPRQVKIIVDHLGTP